MKVLLVTGQEIPHSGGLSAHVEILIDALQKAGHRIRLIHGGRNHSPKMVKLMRLIAVRGDQDKFKAGNFKRLLLNMQMAIEREIAAFEPDIIHSHDVYASTAAFKAKNLGKIPVIQTMHGPALFEAQMGGADITPIFKSLIIKCEKEAAKGVDYFIAVSTGHAQLLKTYYGVAPEKVTVILNSVDLEEIQCATSVRSPLEEPLFFLVPRRMVEKDGVRYAIEAMPLLNNKEAQLLVAGNGPLRQELEELSRKLGVANRVKFIGALPRKELLPLFIKARAVLVPSVPVRNVVEASSIAAIEAMAAENVAIASSIGGLAELIEDGVTGILVPPADAEALAKSMDKILTDEGLRAQLASNALQKVKDNYTAGVWIEKVITVYKKVL